MLHQFSKQDSQLLLFGGSFDPPHLAHLAIARLCLQVFPISPLIFLPSVSSIRHKNQLSDFEHRKELLIRLIGEEPRMAISDLECRENFHYTAQTLAYLRKEYASEIYWICGFDSFASLELWEDWQTILNTTKFIVFSRNGQSLASLPMSQLKKHLHNLLAADIEDFVSQPAPRIYELANFAENCSSSSLRTQLRTGNHQLLETWLRPSQISYIRQHGLYA